MAGQYGELPTGDLLFLYYVEYKGAISLLLERLNRGELRHNQMLQVQIQQ